MGSIHAAQDVPLEDARYEPTSVYRYYDRHGLLIYVGITKQGIGRNRQHNDKAEWWPYVVRQEVEHYATRMAAARREKQLIFDSRPPFNKQHNADHRDLRATYLRLLDTPLPEESPAQQLKRLHRRIPFDVVTRRDDALVLRTRVEHEPLASTLTLEERAAICVWGTGLRVGWANRVDILGSFAYLTCTSNKSLPQNLGDITATLKFHTKPERSPIQRLHVVDAARPVVG